MIVRRHSLLAITDKGRKLAFEQVKATVSLKNPKLVQELIVEGYEGIKVPGIMRREEQEVVKGAIAAGFSSPFRYENGRLRIPAFIPEKEIVRVITPYEVVEQECIYRTSCLQALKQIKEVAQDMTIKIGIWGSCALEVYTGLPYTDDQSDLDLLIGINEFSTIEKFYHSLTTISKKYGCKIDMELDLPIGYGVKVAELFMYTEDVLGKSINDVKLIPKKTILKMLKN